ncbi:MAG: hypothetical protein MZU95_03565 [Desulfomicrobium escambiense]|nr:hypothetical protein [Desulfomicrobium escambiense]
MPASPPSRASTLIDDARKAGRVRKGQDPRGLPPAPSSSSRRRRFRRSRRCCAWPTSAASPSSRGGWERASPAGRFRSTAASSCRWRG